MLAQNLKTPAELGITDEEFDALRKLLGMFERGEIKHAPGLSRVSAIVNSPTCRPDPVYFNMSLVTGEHDCGTAGCILGWAQHIAGKKLFPERHGGLSRLFQMGADACIETLPINIENIQPSHAALALRNFLTHGEPRWAEAIAG